MSCNSATGDVFLADGENSSVIFLPATAAGNAEPHARIVYRSQNPEIPNAVCFMRSTQTLVVCNYKDNDQRTASTEFSLVALSQDGDQWVEHNSVRLLVPAGGPENIYLKTICELVSTESELFCGAALSRKLFRLQMDNSNLVLSGEIIAPKYSDMAAIVTESGTRIALALSEGSLALYSLRSDNRLVELSRHPLLNGFDFLLARVLWNGRLLLAEKIENTVAHSVWELDVTGDRLARRYELLSASDRVWIASWCADEKTLMTCDSASINIQVFECKT